MLHLMPLLLLVLLDCWLNLMEILSDHLVRKDRHFEGLLNLTPLRIGHLDLMLHDLSVLMVIEGLHLLA